MLARLYYYFVFSLVLFWFMEYILFVILFAKARIVFSRVAIKQNPYKIIYNSAINSVLGE